MSAKNSTFITKAKIEELLNTTNDQVSVLTLSKWLRDNTDSKFTIKETMYTKVFHGRFTGYADNKACNI